MAATEAGNSQPRRPERRWHLLTYPLARADDPSAAWRQPVVDVVLILAAVLFGLLILMPSASVRGGPALVVDIVLGTLACGSLVLRRRFPERVGAFAVLASAFSAFAAGASLVALFSAAIRVRLAFLLALTAGELVATFGFPLLHPGASDFSYVAQIAIGSLLNLAVVGWGLMVRAQRDHLRSVMEHARGLEVTQSVLAENARDQERRRIATEMHDALAHRLSLLSVHAGALEFRSDLSPDKTREMAGIIRRTGHQALEDLQEVIGLLRDGGGDGSALLTPHRGVEDLPALVEETRRTDTRVELVLDLVGTEADHGNRAVSAAIYRIIQEGLTNARKHAPRSPVRIVVRPEEPDRVVVNVISELDSDAGGAPAIPGSGAGLRGLEERVSLLGGTFDSGPVEGRFVISGSLPWVR